MTFLRKYVEFDVSHLIQISGLVLTLHSMLSGEDHAKARAYAYICLYLPKISDKPLHGQVFDKPRKGVRKIVLSRVT